MSLFILLNDLKDIFVYWTSFKNSNLYYLYTTFANDGDGVRNGRRSIGLAVHHLALSTDGISLAYAVRCRAGETFLQNHICLI